MSRIGNAPITVPAGVEVALEGNKLTVKGPKGTLTKEFHSNMKITIDGNVITVSRPNNEAQNRSLHGLTRTLISNMIEGTVNEYTRKLEVNGVGYRAAKQGNKLVLTLGYSHPVEMDAPEGITFDVPNPNEIIVRGIVNKSSRQPTIGVSTNDTIYTNNCVHQNSERRERPLH